MRIADNQRFSVNANYLISDRDVDDFMGTVIRWGSDKFKTWEEIIGYFELLGGQ